MGAPRGPLSGPLVWDLSSTRPSLAHHPECSAAWADLCSQTCCPSTSCSCQETGTSGNRPSHQKFWRFHLLCRMQTRHQSPQSTQDSLHLHHLPSKLSPLCQQIWHRLLEKLLIHVQQWGVSVQGCSSLSSEVVLEWSEAWRTCAAAQMQDFLQTHPHSQLVDKDRQSLVHFPHQTACVGLPRFWHQN